MARNGLRVILIVSIAAVIAIGSFSLADPPTGKGKCGSLSNCYDIYKPVICNSDGQVYDNACYAKAACQTGCRPLKF
jgi:hypothetical protein